jgi:hypothetical protein
MHLLPTNLAPLADIAGEQTKFAMNGVRVELLESGRYRAVATDSKRLIVVEGEAPADVTAYPELSALTSAPNGEACATVPAKAWKAHFGKVAKLTGGRKLANKPELRSVPVVCGKEVTTLGGTDLEQTAVETTRNVEGRFPPYADLIPSGPGTAPVKVTVDPKLLAELLAVVAKLGSATEPRVTIELRPDPDGTVRKPLVFRGADAGQSVTALMMPLS